MGQRKYDSRSQKRKAKEIRDMVIQSFVGSMDSLDVNDNAHDLNENEYVDVLNGNIDDLNENEHVNELNKNIDDLNVFKKGLSSPLTSANQGYNDRRNISCRLLEHEKSSSHMLSMKAWKETELRLKKIVTIDVSHERAIIKRKNIGRIF
ncbi:hypothetical protein Ddye_022904 [Dipteronia dyeriana]|uniref:Uncharacterized protein n=1 Tax=Dipteronia dyeriana TaxID=168575 RepID=A0AAD9TS36_9ROSI|nr:hypothetical protein Ddye_022904 [Dipteronia dyeriana]